jgi:hypothetical protein
MRAALKKVLATLTSQITTVGVKVPKPTEKSHKITDDNQAFRNGVIYEKSAASDLRSEVKPKKRGRPSKSNGKN